MGYTGIKGILKDFKGLRDFNEFQMILMEKGTLMDSLEFSTLFDFVKLCFNKFDFV